MRRRHPQRSQRGCRVHEEGQRGVWKERQGCKAGQHDAKGDRASDGAKERDRRHDDATQREAVHGDCRCDHDSRDRLQHAQRHRNHGDIDKEFKMHLVPKPLVGKLVVGQQVWSRLRAGKHPLHNGQRVSASVQHNPQVKPVQRVQRCVVHVVTAVEGKVNARLQGVVHVPHKDAKVRVSLHKQRKEVLCDSTAVRIGSNVGISADE
mmetsp:Transcript_7190/g.23015  ORF Transcript_7190/g.23015 Transcript_7190/m.23015 type:complete len:207 (+) Transcript_7190:1153-1773(+)